MPHNSPLDTEPQNVPEDRLFASLARRRARRDARDAALVPVAPESDVQARLREFRERQGV